MHIFPDVEINKYLHGICHSDVERTVKHTAKKSPYKRNIWLCGGNAFEFASFD